MTKADAVRQAIKEAKLNGAAIAIVIEGPHADEHAEFDDDGHSYGFCPVDAVALLYAHGEKVDVVS